MLNQQIEFCGRHPDILKSLLTLLIAGKPFGFFLFLNVYLKDDQSANHCGKRSDNAQYDPHDGRDMKA